MAPQSNDGEWLDNLEVEITTHESSSGERDDPLEHCSVRFTSEVGGNTVEVGLFTGWASFGLDGHTLWYWADAAGPDAEGIARAAADWTEDSIRNADRIDHVFLLDRVWIHEAFRGRGLLGTLVADMVECLDESERWLVTTEPEPSPPKGGWSDDEAHARARQGLLRSISDAGFAPFANPAFYWSVI